jgi:hypothetical protein
MMDTYGFIQNIAKRLSINRLGHLQGHYAAIRTSLPTQNVKDREEVVYFCAQFERYSTITTRLSKWRIILYILSVASVLVNLLILLFASAIKNLIILIPALSFLEPFTHLSNFSLLTTFIIIMIFLLNAKINLNLQIMQTCLSHLSTLYAKNPKRDTIEVTKALKRII